MRTARFILVLAIGLIAAVSQGAPVTVQNLRMWRAPDHTRLVFDLSGPLTHRLFVLSNPHRIVIDMENARLQGELPNLDFSGPRLTGVRTGSRGDQQLRVVFDLKQATRPRTFVLKPYGQYGHRLVIDLYDVGAAARTQRSQPARARRSEAIVAIDAGHGGEDPGAIGRRYRTKEKNVTLAIARELKKLVNAAPGMRAVMIRDGDYYVDLRQRFTKARRHEANIFISIHADALPGRRTRARGVSVYALSKRGASSMLAKTLADKENASDLIGGVSLNDKDDVLAKVLLDLSQTATIGSSLTLGADVLYELRRVAPIHLDTVQQAGFAVLKAPDVPSVLIETAFISNPAEEKKLRSRPYQRKLARAMFNGVRRYLKRDTRATPSKGVISNSGHIHVVQPGETLSGIARAYRIHEDALRFANNLRGSQLQAGRKLIIP
ncbi:MAG: N-acetylmuramoyl-L-alanine amidase [Acidiferrobacterales bacterium]